MENDKIQAVHFHRKTGGGRYPTERFGAENAKKARSFHRSFPEYKETPLVELNALAKKLGVASVHVKDESYRFGLNAFKVLGGSYTIGNYIAKKLGVRAEIGLRINPNFTMDDPEKGAGGKFGIDEDLFNEYAEHIKSLEQNWHAIPVLYRAGLVPLY